MKQFTYTEELSSWAPDSRDRDRGCDEYAIFEFEARERDKYTCCKCHRSRHYIVHHVIPYAERPDIRHNPDNGVVMCDICHTKFHSIFGRKGNNAEQLEFYVSHTMNDENVKQAKTMRWDFAPKGDSKN